MHYLFTCTNYFIFCLQVGVYGNLEVLIYPAGWVWRFWVCISSPVGSLWVQMSKFREEGMKPISALILRRDVQPILFHQQYPSYVYSIISIQRRRGVPFPLLCISLPSACSSKAGSNLGLRSPTVEGNSLPQKCSKPELSRTPAVGSGNPLQYSCLENPMDREAWQGYSPRNCKESATTERLSTCIQLI